MRVQRDVRAAERIADIVHRELKKRQQLGKIKVLIARIADVVTPQPAEPRVQILQPVLIVCGKLRARSVHGFRERSSGPRLRTQTPARSIFAL